MYHPPSCSQQLLAGALRLLKAVSNAFVAAERGLAAAGACERQKGTRKPFKVFMMTASQILSAAIREEVAAESSRDSERLL